MVRDFFNMDGEVWSSHQVPDNLDAPFFWYQFDNIREVAMIFNLLQTKRLATC